MLRQFQLLFAATAAIAFAQPASQPLWIEHVRVFDGNRVLANTNVLVEGSEIRAVGSAAKKPANALVVDGTGKTLLPGLIDAHTHTIEVPALRQAPVFGVTTDLDMFTEPKSAASIKQQQKEGKLADYVNLRSAGYLATAPGGHGTEYGLVVPTLTKPDEAQSWVDARIAEGSDYIKAVYDDALEYGSGHATPTISPEILKALGVAAHKRGKMLVVHIGSLQQAKTAIEAGADGLVHLFVGPSSDAEFPKLASSHHIFVIPTLTVLQSICATPFNAALADDPQIKPYLLPTSIAAMKRTFPMGTKISCEGAYEAVRQLKAVGVPILAGTDAGNPGTTQGASVHGELELLVRSGLTPMEALHDATAASAAAFHLDDRGVIAPGKRADLVLVNGDPTTDIRKTRDIAAVWEAGHEIDRAAWKTDVAKQLDDASRQKTAAPPAGSESGLISDFEQPGQPTATFGAGWTLSTDQMAGGKSEAKMEVVQGGAEGSKGYLSVSGEVKAGFGFPWSGVLFSPGATMMAPVNLSTRKTIEFWAKGDSTTYEIMLFTTRGGYQPSIQTFTATPEWQKITIPLAKFGTDGSDIMAFCWAAGPKTGKFTLGLDNIRLQ